MVGYESDKRSGERRPWFGRSGCWCSQSLSTLLEEINAASLAFWLRKFIGEVANLEGPRYPARTLYCILSGLNQYLSEVRGREANSVLDKDNRR